MPDPRIPPNNPLPPPPTPVIENEIQLPDNDEVGWVVFGEVTKFYVSKGGAVTMFSTQTVNRQPANIDTSRDIEYILPFDVDIKTSHPNSAPPNYLARKGSLLGSQSLSPGRGRGNRDIQYPVKVVWDGYYNHRVAFLGVAKTINKFINDYNEDETRQLQDWMADIHKSGFNHTSMVKLAPTAFIPLVEIPIKPPLPTGNKPPMQDCCEEILEILEDIKEVLAVDKVLKDKFPVSNTFMAPNCDPTSVTEATNYYEIMQCAFRVMAHGLIFEPKANIKDADAAKAGDQEFKAKYLNATGWASAVAEALLEVKDDGNVGTNMDIRNGFAATQTMVGMADALYKLDAILDCLGVTLMPKVETVETPYNLMIQVGKGFGDDNERQVDLNKDEATEALLPQLLQTKKNKIKTVQIHPRSRTLHEILENIEAGISTGTNG